MAAETRGSLQENKEIETAKEALKYFDINKPVVVQTDVSTDGLGAVQLQDDCPVGYGVLLNLKKIMLQLSSNY